LYHVSKIFTKIGTNPKLQKWNRWNNGFFAIEVKEFSSYDLRFFLRIPFIIFLPQQFSDGKYYTFAAKISPMKNINFKTSILQGIPNKLPTMPAWDNSISHAPKRKDILTVDEKKLALKNAHSIAATSLT